MRQCVLLLLIAALSLASCAAPGPKTSTAATAGALTGGQAGSGKIGVIELFPEGVLTRHQYGTLAGINRAHYHYDFPMDVGGELRDAIVSALNQKAPQKAAPIPASSSLMNTTITAKEWTAPQLRSAPALWEKQGVIKSERVITPAFQQELKQLAAQYGVSRILFVYPILASPYNFDAYPGGYNYGVYTQDVLGSNDVKVTFLFAGAAMVDVASMKLLGQSLSPENAIPMKEIALEDVGPPDMALVTSNLKTLIGLFAKKVAAES